MEEYEAKVKANIVEVAEAEGCGHGLATQSVAHAVAGWIEAVAMRDRPVVTHSAE